MEQIRFDATMIHPRRNLVLLLVFLALFASQLSGCDEADSSSSSTSQSSIPSGAASTATSHVASEAASEGTVAGDASAIPSQPIAANDSPLSAPSPSASAGTGSATAEWVPPRFLPELPAVAATFDDGTLRQRPEFEEMARKAYTDGEPRFFSRLEIAHFSKRLAEPNLQPWEKMEAGAQLAHALMEEGDLDRAVIEARRVAEIGKAFPELIETNLPFHWLVGLIHLRRAEVQNCIARHNADCCVFPLQGDGVHSEREPAESAREAFMACLRIQPADLRGRWMVNLLAMALDEYPDAVPPELLIPPSAFDSDYDIKRFPDIAAKVGLNIYNYAGGAMAEDFDGDGLLDMVTSSWHVEQPMTFKRNDGKGWFEDRSTDSRLDDQMGGLECVAADYDNDGDMDILVLRGAWLYDDGRMRNSLLRNDGKGVFTDVTRAAGLADPAAPTQAGVWADFDNDGDLDLFIGNESRATPTDPSGNYPSQLFRNNGDGTFGDIAVQAGVTNDRYTKGATAGDYDNDGWVDLYVSNIGPNRLYRNNGNMTFSDVATSAGVTEPSVRSFATWFFDFDNDGWLDIYVGAYDATMADVCAHYVKMPDRATRPCLYRNNGNGTFTNIAKGVGLDLPLLPMGANFGDLDNDGWLDLYITTGNPDLDTLMPNVMLRNDGGKRFQNVTKSGGFGHLQKGHGVAFADFDNDGDQDVFHQIGGFFNTDGFRNALYQNPGHGNHFISIDVQGVKSNRNGMGARIKIVVRTPGGMRELHRAVGSISSFGGSPVSRIPIGLGDASAIESITIVWPASGVTQTLEDVPMDAFIKVVEGEPGFQTLNPPKIDF